MKVKLLLLSIVIIALTGCVHERVIYRDPVPNPSDEVTTQEPPEVIQERVTVAPSAVHVWIGGHWGWRHGAYAWAPGYWARGPRYGAHWAPGVWSRHQRGWRWRQGYWY
jgi:WXXGXW repeat (2 copies)